MRSDPATARFTIGALARQADVAIDTVRYYERQGLLPLAPRRASGYREYDAAAVQRVRFIRRAKELGFSLEEIGELLALQDDRVHGVEGIKQRASARLQALDRRIAELTEMRDTLAALVEECPGRGAPDACPILGDIRGDGAGEPSR
ncbi:heavy metal-responsive transcriptional regulator [Xanthomonas sacchari]